MRVAASQDVLHHGAVLEQGEILERPSDPDRGEPGGRDGRKINPGERDATAAGPQHAGDHVEQRRLAGAIRAYHAADFPCVDRKADVGDRLQAAETLAEVFDREQGGHDSHRLRRL